MRAAAEPETQLIPSSQVQLKYTRFVDVMQKWLTYKKYRGILTGHLS